MIKVVSKLALLFVFCFTLCYGSVFAQGNLEFSFDREKKTIEVSIKQNDRRFYVKGNIDSEGNFYLDGSLDNITLFGKDAVLDIVGRGRIIQDSPEVSLKGSVILRHIVFGGKPLDNLILNYQVNNDKLFITSCRWETFSLRGEIGLKEPFDANVDLVISDMDLKDFCRMLGLKDEGLLLSGRILGLAHIKCKDGMVDVKTQLHSRDGFINKLDFKEANIVLEGLFPALHFVNSWMLKKDDSYMNIEGHFDLTNLSDLKSSNHKVDLIPADEKFGIFDWIVSVKKGIAEGLNLKKSISEDITFSMDTFSYDNDTERYKNGDSIGLEYKMTEEQRLKMYLKEDEEIIGWEQVFKF